MGGGGSTAAAIAKVTAGAPLLLSRLFFRARFATGKFDMKTVCQRFGGVLTFCNGLVLVGVVDGSRGGLGGVVSGGRECWLCVKDFDARDPGKIGG